MKRPAFHLPGIPAERLDDAATVLEECLHRREALGHRAPFFSPGGAYGDCWWSLDEALALSGYKWLNRPQAEEIFLNLIATQLPSGRVKLWGWDYIPHIDIADRRAEVGSLPMFFETGEALCREANDSDFVAEVYRFFCANLDWWFAERGDPETGLISALFEETFVPYLHGEVREYAPVDTNVLVASACGHAAELARRLGRTDDIPLLLERRNDILAAVNRYLWDEDDQAYYPYLLREKRRKKLLLASTFSGLVAAAGDPGRVARLTALLQDDARFNWATWPLTSAAKTDPTFTVTTGDYQGNASWSGSVWTLLNDSAVRALLAAGKTAVAGDLAWKTVRAFAGNYAEFLDPRDGRGHGVPRYAWTAGQVLRLAVECLFGVDYRGEERICHVRPLPVPVLAGQAIALHGLSLPNGETLSLVIEYRKDGTPEIRRSNRQAGR